VKLVYDDLQMFLWERLPDVGLSHQSDKGAQYVSHAFRKLLDANGITVSMSRKGYSWFP
jgi:transposase InsO family protein